jgi:fibronectin-binding autotransporter adhesin
MRTFHSKSKVRHGLMLSAAALFGLAATQGRADTLYWDPGNNFSAPGSGGAGTWDLSTQGWFDQDLGGEVYWNNAGWTNGADDAVFGGSSGGAVFINAPIVANSLVFNTTGYTLSGGSLSLVTGNITVGAGLQATINSPLSGNSGLTLTGAGGGMLSLGGTNRYNGDTSIQAGTLQTLVNNAIPANATLNLGLPGGTTPVTFDLTTTNQTIANLNVLSNIARTSNIISMGLGSTLTITGIPGAALNFGPLPSVTTSDVTNVSFAGAGIGQMNGSSLVVNPGGAVPGVQLQIGSITGGDSATVDMRHLPSFTGNFSLVRVGDASSSPTTGNSTLYLAPNSTVTASAIHIGSDSGTPDAAQTLVLGDISTTLNADAIQVGGNVGTGYGEIKFNSSSGSLTIQGSGGSGAVSAFDMINSNSANSTNLQSNFDLSNHVANIAIGTLTMAARSAGAASNGLDVGNATSNFLFSPISGGSLTIASAVLADRSGTGAMPAGNMNATVLLNGDPYTAISLGTVSMAQNTYSGPGTQTGSSTAMLQIYGGSATIGSISLANNTSTLSGNVSTGTLTISGGTVTMNGDITRAGGGGIENTTLGLSGGTLDMNGHNIGGVNPVGSGTGSISFEGGTLQNVLQINGGTTGLRKIGPRTLVLTGAMGNAYSGGTFVDDGTLLANSPNTTVGSTGPGGIVVGGGGVLAGIGQIVESTGQIVITASPTGKGVTISGGSGATAADTTGLLTTKFAGAGNTYNQLWGAGGTYAWKVNAASPTNSTVQNSSSTGTTEPSGVSGANWDMISMTSLDLTPTSGQFNLQVIPTGNSASSFNAAQPHTWTIADITSGIVRVNGGNYNGNSAAMLASLQAPLQAAFGLNTSGLPAPRNNFSVMAMSDMASGDNIVIVYTPAPEPSALALLGMSAAALIARRRRMH